MTKKTVCYYIERLVNYYNDREALIFKKTYRTQKWSYLDLYNYAHRIAGVFEEHGLKKGDKIIIYSYNCPEWGAILLACAISGIIAVPLDFNSNKKFVKKISDTVKSKILFCSRYKPIKTNSKQILIEDLFEHIKKHHKYRCKANIKEDDILEIVYTSGTTSEPKGVIITNKNLVSNIRSLRLVFPLKKHLKFLSIVPLSHMFEQTVGFFIPLRFGCQIVYTTSRKSSSIKDAMYDEKVTSIVAVPVILKTLMNKIKRTVERKNKTKQFEFLLNISKKLPFFTRRILFKKVLNNLSPKLKFFVVGGAPLNNDVEHFWNSLGVLVLQGYGLTETSPILTCNSFKHHKEGTVGQVLPNQKIKISNDNEIICSGENVTSGYYKNKNATNKSLVNGWFYTGDFGKFDEQGYLSIKGRKKNMILTSSGLNVYPEDIEKIINRIDFVKDSIVLGIKETKDTIIIAVILLKKITMLIILIKQIL
ncbi:AMP-binding protein [archaeon]|nr:AMP-binding protein [archaeon]